MSRGGYAHPPCMVTKMSMRVARCFGVAKITFGLGVGACAVSPIVGEENGNGGSGGSGGLPGGGADSSGGGERRGTAELIGNVRTLSSQASRPGVTLACLPGPLPEDAAGDLPCAVFSTQLPPASTECRCDEIGKRPVSEEVRSLLESELMAGALCGPGTDLDCSDYCFCEYLPAVGADAEACLNDPDPLPPDKGWCYVDPALGRGAPALVAECPIYEKRRLRGLPLDDLILLACAGGPLTLGPTPPGPGAIGTPCLPQTELDPGHYGFAMSQVTLEFGSPECNSNLCLVNHFQGRASCPYGQAQADLETAPQCFLPGSDEAVTVPVAPQLMTRRAEEHVVCSCRCDGPGPGPFCTCPTGTQCEPLVTAIPVPDSDLYAGSYCIPEGTRYDPTYPPPGIPCRISDVNCEDPRSVSFP